MARSWSEIEAEMQADGVPDAEQAHVREEYRSQQPLRVLGAIRAGYRGSPAGLYTEAGKGEEPFEPGTGWRGAVENVAEGIGGMAGSPGTAVMATTALGVPAPAALGGGMALDALLRARLRGEPWGESAKEAAQEGGLGALTGKAGSLVRTALPAVEAAPVIERLLRQAAAPAAEATTIGTGGEVLQAIREGREPEVGRMVEGTETGLGMMGVAHGAQALLGKIIGPHVTIPFRSQPEVPGTGAGSTPPGGEVLPEGTSGTPIHGVETIGPAVEPDAVLPPEASVRRVAGQLPAPEPQPIQVTPEGDALLPGQERPMPTPPGEPSAEQEYMAETVQRFGREKAEADAALRATQAEPPGGPEPVGVQPEEMPTHAEMPAIPPPVTPPAAAQPPEAPPPAPAQPPGPDEFQQIADRSGAIARTGTDPVTGQKYGLKARKIEAATEQRALEALSRLRLGEPPPGESPAGPPNAALAPPAESPALTPPGQPVLAPPEPPGGPPTAGRPSGLDQRALRLLALIRGTAKVVQTGMDRTGQPLSENVLRLAQSQLGQLLEQAKREGLPVAQERGAAPAEPVVPALGGVAAPTAVPTEQRSLAFPGLSPAEGLPVPKNRKNQAGALFPRKPRMDSTPSDPEVAAVLVDKSRGLPVRERLQMATHRVRRGIDSIFGAFEPGLREFPATRDRFRKAKDTWFKSAQWAQNELAHVIGDLDRQGASGEYELFRNIAVLADMADRSAHGQTQPGALEPERYSAALDELVKRASPAVKTAWDRHVHLMRQVALEEVQRGKLHASVLEKAAYYPHQIIDLSDTYGEMIAGLPRSLKEPFVGSRQRALGSEKPFELNYADAMYRHLIKLKVAWDVDDFAQDVLQREDVLTSMSQTERAARFGVRADGRPNAPVVQGKRYFVEGKSYVGYQYQPFQWGTEAPSNVHQAIVLDAAYRPTQRVYLVPETIAKRLYDFHRPREYSDLESGFRRYAGSWKRLVIDYAGLRFFYKNIPSDVVDFFREDAGVLGELALNPGRVGRFITGVAGRETPEGGVAEQVFGKPRPEELPIYKAAQEQDVLGGSTFFGPQGGPGILARRRMMGRLSPAHRLGLRNPLLESWERMGSAREAAPRVASFLRDYDRIAQGKPVIVKTVDIAGLDPISAAGKKARESAIDYAKTSPAFDRGIRSFVAPFATWYSREVYAWGKYLTNHPVEAAAKLGAVATTASAFGLLRDWQAGKEHDTDDVLTSLLPIYGLWYWNNHVHPDVEKNLPDRVQGIPWHINTGYQTEDGKPLVYVPEIGMDPLVRALGVEKVPHLLGKLARKEITQDQFLKGLLGETVGRAKLPEEAGGATVPFAPLGPFRLLGDLSPLYQLVEGLQTNRDPFTKRAIVSPPGLIGTATGNRMMLEYAVRELVPAYGKLVQAVEAADRHPGEAHGLLGRFTKGVLDHGPLDPNPFHALEVPVDLAAGRIGRGREAAEQAKLTREESLYGIERGVIAERAKGESGAIKAAIAEAKQAGVPVTRDDVLRRMKSFRFQRGLAEAKLHEAPDAATQERARQVLERIKRAQALVGLKKLPKATRGAAGKAMQ